MFVYAALHQQGCTWCKFDVHIIAVLWQPSWLVSTLLACLPEIVGSCPPFPGKILVIPRADRSFTERGRTVQEHLHATPRVQFVERFQVHPSPDCEHIARELKCDTLGALLLVKEQILGFGRVVDMVRTLCV